jgi:lysophospholipase L1-like esterase
MKTARIYAFGDSITYGAWDSQGGWCDRLKRKLHELTINKEHEVKFQMLNLGIGGENSRSLLKRFKSEIEARYRMDWPVIIIIATGANDTRYVENGDPAVSIEEYQSNLEKLINIAKEYTDKILFVGVAAMENEIQPFKKTLLSNELLKKYNEVMADVASKNNIPKVDVTNAFKSSNKAVYSIDGVHPNDAGHEIIEDLVWTELEKLLN